MSSEEEQKSFDHPKESWRGFRSGKLTKRFGSHRGMKSLSQEEGQIGLGVQKKARGVLL